MHKYFFHVGDFNRATRHLTRIERSVYRDLIDLYMDTESMLDADLPRLCRKIIATSEQESTAVEQVLNEFFILTDGGWFNSRCDEELNGYKSNKSQKSEAGRASAEAKRLKKHQLIDANKCSTYVQRTFNETSTASQLTSNRKPVTNNQVISAEKSETHTSKPKSKKTSLPADFAVSESVKSWAIEKGHANLDAHLESFKLKAAAAGYQYVNWDSAFMGAIRDNWAKVPAVTAKAVDSWQGRDF